jgi:hypothetical protein
VKLPVTPHLDVPESYPNSSPTSCVSCCTTIPPSPVVPDPEANSTNLSATCRLVVDWNDAVPCTTTSLLNVIVSPENVLLPEIVSAKPIVYEGAPPNAWAAVPVISISPAVCDKVIVVLPCTAVPALEP